MARRARQRRHESIAERRQRVAGRLVHPGVQQAEHRGQAADRPGSVEQVSHHRAAVQALVHEAESAGDSRRPEEDRCADAGAVRQARCPRLRLAELVGESGFQDLQDPVIAAGIDLGGSSRGQEHAQRRSAVFSHRTQRIGCEP
jgi:hypothetical protein